MSADTDYDCNFITEEQEAAGRKAHAERYVRALIAKNFSKEDARKPFFERLVAALCKTSTTREIAAWKSALNAKATVKPSEATALRAYEWFCKNAFDGEKTIDEYRIATIAKFLQES